MKQKYPEITLTLILHRLIIPFVLFLIISMVTGCMAIGPQPIPKAFDFKVIKEQAKAVKIPPSVTGPLSLEEAMERAMIFNLDHQVAKLNVALASLQYKASRFDLLPELTTAAGYTTRDKIYASSSQSVLTHQESLEPSTSLDKRTRTADLTLSWNLLDFGMSYFQMHQQADQVLIAKERRRKAAQNLMIQLRQAFWNAYGAQRMTDSINKAVIKAENALEVAGKSGRERLRPLLEDLLYRKQLMVMIRELEGLRDEMDRAWPILANLINLPIGQRVELIAQENLPLPELSLSLEQMEVQALKNRPELVEIGYQQRINALDTKKELTRLLPQIDFSMGHHYDSNSYLVHNKWNQGAAQISWNLLNLVSAPSKMKAARARENVTRTATLALGMAVLSQVHVANLDFAMQLNRFKRAQALRLIDEEIHLQIKKELTGKMGTWLDETRSLVDLLMARLYEYNAYAQLQTSHGQVEATMGMGGIL